MPGQFILLTREIIISKAVTFQDKRSMTKLSFHVDLMIKRHIPETIYCSRSWPSIYRAMKVTNSDRINMPIVTATDQNMRKLLHDFNEQTSINICAMFRFYRIFFTRSPSPRSSARIRAFYRAQCRHFTRFSNFLKFLPLYKALEFFDIFS